MPQKYSFVAAYDRSNLHGVLVEDVKYAPLVYCTSSTP